MNSLTEVKKTDKLWGFEFEIINTDKYCGKVLVLMPGKQSSLHYHGIKDETMLCIEGRIGLELQDVSLIMKAGDSVRLRPGTVHRFRALGDIAALLVEFSTSHSDDDVTRLEESCACASATCEEQ